MNSRARFGFLVANVLVLATLLGLGAWQWQRRAEKRDFIAALRAGATAPPRPLAEAELWQRVRVTGVFQHDKTAYVRTSRPEAKPGERDSRGNVPVSGFGVLVMTPLLTRQCGADGRCGLRNLYVNRGFLPTPADGRIPAYDRPEGEVTLVGFLRPSETPGLFQPGNDPARRVWFHRSTEAMAKAVDLHGADARPSPYDRFLDREASELETAPPFGVVATDFLRAIPDNHTQYAFTWWSLAGVQVVVATLFLRRRRRAA